MRDVFLNISRMFVSENGYNRYSIVEIICQGIGIAH